MLKIDLLLQHTQQTVTRKSTKVWGKVVIFLNMGCSKFEHEILMASTVDYVILGIHIMHTEICSSCWEQYLEDHASTVYLQQVHHKHQWICQPDSCNDTTKLWENHNDQSWYNVRCREYSKLALNSTPGILAARSLVKPNMNGSILASHNYLKISCHLIEKHVWDRK